MSAICVARPTNATAGHRWHVHPTLLAVAELHRLDIAHRAYSTGPDEFARLQAASIEAAVESDRIDELAAFSLCGEHSGFRRLHYERLVTQHMPGALQRESNVLGVQGMWCRNDGKCGAVGFRQGIERRRKGCAGAMSQSTRGIRRRRVEDACKDNIGVGFQPRRVIVA